jgi:sialate O-acetylesterase
MKQWDSGGHLPKTVAALILILLSALPSQADIRLAGVFGNNMVLQQGAPLPVWGWADPGEKVAVELRGKKKTATANDLGEWMVELSAQKAGGPYTMTVTGNDVIELKNILLGEVWLCSGQSNMEMGIGACLDPEEEIAAADYPQIRLLNIPKKFTTFPQDSVEAKWIVCSPETIGKGGWGGFSAAAYYFGRQLHTSLDLPVGLIQSAWGGTRIEPWTPPEGFAAVPAVAEVYEQTLLADPRSDMHKERLDQALAEIEKWLTTARQARDSDQVVPTMPAYPQELLPPQNQQSPTALYNAMIHPLIPFALRGAIWYQGESNHGEGMLYTEKMKALIGGWRQLWRQGDFPFYYVQIAPYPYGNELPTILPEFWTAQTAAMQIPNTGMAVIHDIGDLADIHPKNKREVGRRLALWALAKTYGKKDLVYSGPICRSMKIEGNKIRLTFDHAGSGLASRDGRPLDCFELIDADRGGFVEATAKIDGNALLVSAPTTDKPVAVRFAWHKLAEPNLMNAEGLPATPFQMGEIPQRDLLEMEVPESGDYQLVFDLDLKKLGETISYDADKSDRIDRPFDRIAYFVELQDGKGRTSYLYASMDAFTDEVTRIGVPTFTSEAQFQQAVAHLNVWSNASGIVTGIGLEGGNIEFWPQNYAPGNAASVLGASGSVYDFGDQPVERAKGYGSMQVHNREASQTLFAINHWSTGGKADIGIGNRSESHPDWTFAGNAHTYPTGRLRVLVRLR